MWIYENSKTKTRVVVLPLQNDIADVKNSEDFYSDLKKKTEENNKQIKDRGLQGDALSTAK